MAMPRLPACGRRGTMQAMTQAESQDAVPPGAPRPVSTPGALRASITQGSLDGETYDRELPVRRQATLC
jgi:uncharacterized protein